MSKTKIKLIIASGIMLMSAVTLAHILNRNLIVWCLGNTQTCIQELSLTQFKLMQNKTTQAPDKISATSTISTTLSQWLVTANLPTKTHPYPMFAYNGALYVHTGLVGSGARKVYFATPDQDGNITSWQVAWNDHGGIHGFTALVAGGIPYHFRNGHIAKYVFKADGTVDGDVELLENDMNESFGGNKWVWDSAVYVPFASAKYVFHLGGFSMPPDYRYKGDIYGSEVPIGSEFTDTGSVHPDIGSGSGKGAFYLPAPDSAFGYIYTRGNLKTTLFRTRVDNGGGLGEWENLGELPSANENKKGDIFVLGKTLYVVLGSKVHATDLDPETGDVIGWTDDPQDLPSKQVHDDTWGGGHLEGSTVAEIGEYVYLASDNKVYYAKINTQAEVPPTDVPGATSTQTPTPTTTPTGAPGGSTGSPTSTPTLTPTSSISQASTPSPTRTPSQTPTITPSHTGTPTITLTPTPTFPSSAICDKLCGVCGWRDTAGTCHTTGTLPQTGSACCYSTCINNTCKSVSGIGASNCTLGQSCTQPNGGQTTPLTPNISQSIASNPSPPVTIIYITATPKPTNLQATQVAKSPGGGQGSVNPNIPNNNQPKNTPPVSGNTGWLMLLAIPLVIIGAGILL